MRWDDETHVTPCAKCPYRKDAPLGLWHPDHFRKLMRDEEDAMGGPVYGCHNDGKKPAEEVRPCVGWLLDQQRKGVPSIQLRLSLIRNKAAGRLLTRIHAAGLKLWPNITAMCRANGVRADSRAGRRTKT